MTLFRLAGYGLAAWLCAGSAAAVPVLDQHYDANASNFIVADRLNLAQTFTVGIGGTLTGVAVEIRNLCASPSNCFEPQVPLVLDVRRTLGGVPVEANSGIDILGTASIPWASTPFNADFSFTWVDFALDGFPVAPGDVLALVLRAPGSGGAQPFVWAGNHGLDWAPTPGTYAGGREYLRFFGGNWGNYPGQSSANGDFSFRVFVEPAPAPEPVATPEPGSLAVLGGMLAMLAGRRWAGGGPGGQPGSSPAR